MSKHSTIQAIGEEETKSTVKVVVHPRKLTLRKLVTSSDAGSEPNSHSLTGKNDLTGNVGMDNGIPPFVGRDSKNPSGSTHPASIHHTRLQQQLREDDHSETASTINSQFQYPSNNGNNFAGSSTLRLGFDLSTVEGQLRSIPNMPMASAKTAAKREYNRLNAARARQRNKAGVDQLHDRITELEETIASLQEQNRELRRELGKEDDDEKDQERDGGDISRTLRALEKPDDLKSRTAIVNMKRAKSKAVSSSDNEKSAPMEDATIQPSSQLASEDPKHHDKKQKQNTSEKLNSRSLDSPCASQSDARSKAVSSESFTSPSLSNVPAQQQQPQAPSPQNPDVLRQLQHLLSVQQQQQQPQPNQLQQLLSAQHQQQPSNPNILIQLQQLLSAQQQLPQSQPQPQPNSDALTQLQQALNLQHQRQQDRLGAIDPATALFTLQHQQRQQQLRQNDEAALLRQLLLRNGSNQGDSLLLGVLGTAAATAIGGSGMAVGGGSNELLSSSSGPTLALPSLSSSSTDQQQQKLLRNILLLQQLE